MPEPGTVLIIDSDINSADMTKNVLNKISSSDVKIITSLNYAKEFITSNKIIFIIMDLKINGEPVLEFIKDLRRNTDNQNYKSPVFILSSNATKAEVSQARDAGATEFMVKPFSTSSLNETIVSSLQNPRDFIISRNYVGPDRRRKKQEAPEGIEKREENPKE